MLCYTSMGCISKALQCSHSCTHDDAKNREKFSEWNFSQIYSDSAHLPVQEWSCTLHLYSPCAWVGIFFKKLSPLHEKVVFWPIIGQKTTFSCRDEDKVKSCFKEYFSWFECCSTACMGWSDALFWRTWVSFSNKTIQPRGGRAEKPPAQLFKEWTTLSTQ